MTDEEHTRENAKERMAGSLRRFHLDAEIAALQEEDAYRQGRMNQTALVQEKPLRAALFVFHAGNQLPTHHAPGPITVQVLRGRIIFGTEEGTRDEMAAGDMLSLAAGVTHSVEALEDSAMLLTLSAA
jgi:quercetin dioxygenase-like cupin family protein